MELTHTPELVVFDIAGTTVYDEDNVAGALQDALGEHGLDYSLREVTPLLGVPKPVAIQTLLDSRGIQMDIEGIHKRFLNLIADHYRTHPSVRPMEGADETFERLKSAGVRIALDTGFDRPTTNIILERLNWSVGVFHATATSDEVRRGRPYPDLILKIMEDLGVDDVSLVAKVGDTPSDLQEGTAAGCGWVIGVLNGSHSREELEVFAHTHLVDSICDVPSIVLAAQAVG